MCLSANLQRNQCNAANRAQIATTRHAEKVLSIHETALDHSSHAERFLSSANPVEVQQRPKLGWRSYIWDTFDKSPEERRFLFRLDAILLTLASLGYFIKYLDQVNVNNAFVSGMKEDFALYGDQLNYMQTCWTVGYVLGEIPSNLLLTKIRLSIWIPSCEATWAVLTILLAKCSNAQQLYVLRFFIGLAESSFYPGMQYIIGSWYRRDELAKRSCIFHVSSAIGTMFSGYLMVAVYHLDGAQGWHGWQWLFIVNTIISLPIAISGYFLLPDFPETTRVFYLTEQEIAIARRRMQLEGRASTVNRDQTRSAIFNLQRLKKLFGSWHIYILSLLYILFNNGNGGTSQPAFQLWLKSRGFSIEHVNTYPTLTSAVQVITTLIYAWTSDTCFRGARWPPIVCSGSVLVIVYSSLTAWHISVGWKWACFILMGCGGGISGLWFAWAHEICRDDTVERALVVAAMNEMACVFQAWLPLLVWKQVEAPVYRKGYTTMVAVNVGLIATALAVRSLHRRDLRWGRKAPTTDDVDGSSSEVSA